MSDKYKLQRQLVQDFINMKFIMLCLVAITIWQILAEDYVEVIALMTLLFMLGKLKEKYKKQLVND